MAKEFVRKVRNISNVESLSINETIPADLVLDTDYKLWYHGKNRHVKLANDEEVVHNFGDEEIKGLKTFDDLLTAKDGITDEGDLVVLGEAKVSKGLTVGGDETIAGNLTVTGGCVTDGLEVKGDATFEKGVVVTGDCEVKGNETIEKDLTVLGNAHFNQSLTYGKNVPLTDGEVNSSATNPVLKYQIINNVIYISGSIDVVASDSMGESIKIGNIPEEYQPKKEVNGVGKVHLPVGLLSITSEIAQVVVVGDENAAAKGAVMFSVTSTTKLVAGTWTFYGSYSLG